MITTYTYDRANRLKTVNAGGSVTTYTHDRAGYLIQKQSAIDLTEYTWNAAGDMTGAEVTAGTVNFTYNADGQRVSKESTDSSVKGFLYDYKKLIAETEDVGGDIVKSYDTTSDQEFGDLISEDGDNVYYQFDAQANANALLDELGTVKARFKYDAFGRLANSSVDGDAWSSLSVDQWAILPVGAEHHQ
jgi:YD repeat-containing protein